MLIQCQAAVKRCQFYVLTTPGRLFYFFEKGIVDILKILTLTHKQGEPMNGPIFIAGIAAAFCTLGHFTVGRKQYLLPMLAATFDDVAKKVNQCVFHYVSVFLVLSAAALLAIGSGAALPAGTAGLARFIALNYALFAVVQIIIAATSGIQGAIFKMFQWTIFMFIAVFAWIG